MEADRHAISPGVSGAVAGVGGEFAGVVPRLAGPLLLVGPAVVVVVEVQCVAGPVAVGVPRGQRVVERVPAADDLVQVRPAVVVVVEVLGQQGRAARQDRVRASVEVVVEVRAGVGWERVEVVQVAVVVVVGVPQVEPPVQIGVARVEVYVDEDRGIPIPRGIVEVVEARIAPAVDLGGGGDHAGPLVAGLDALGAVRAVGHDVSPVVVAGAGVPEHAIAARSPAVDVSGRGDPAGVVRLVTGVHIDDGVQCGCQIKHSVGQ